jgi:S-adenosylmethionine decarboxylase
MNGLNQTVEAGVYTIRVDKTKMLVNNSCGSFDLNSNSLFLGENFQMQELTVLKVETSSRKPFSGLHIIANLTTSREILLTDPQSLKSFLDQSLVHHQLQKVGEVYHSFPQAGYTAIIGLTESHLSIHTWPEHNYITFDVFISNHSKDNTSITQKLYQDVIQYFNATVVEEHFISR